MKRKPTVAFDFDGVIHSYTSGWVNYDTIPDPVVPGIKAVIDQLRQDGYSVAIYSSRCNVITGLNAVERYLEKNKITVDAIRSDKPPAIAYVDDRAILFDGKTDGLVDRIKSFKSWTEKSESTNECRTGECNNGACKSLRPVSAQVYRNGEFHNVNGRLHGWTVDYEELGDCVGHFPAAIVETDDGAVVIAPASGIKFLDR